MLDWRRLFDDGTEKEKGEVMDCVRIDQLEMTSASLPLAHAEERKAETETIQIRPRN